MRFATAILLFTATLTLPAQESKLERVVTIYYSRAQSTKDAVLDVANRFQLPMGIEWIEDGPQVAAGSWVNVTVRAILEDIVNASPGYSLDISNDVVHVFPTALKNDAADVLNLHIGVFEVTNAFPPSIVAMTLPERLRKLVESPIPNKPNMVLGGSVLMSGNESTVTFRLDDPTVREILDRMVQTESRNIWIVRYPASLEKTNLGYLKTLRTRENKVQDDWQYFPSFDLRAWQKFPPGLVQ
jgi:hypothetical protein